MMAALDVALQRLSIKLRRIATVPDGNYGAALPSCRCVYTVPY